MAQRAHEIERLIWWEQAPERGEVAAEKGENAPIVAIALLETGACYNAEPPRPSDAGTEVPSNPLSVDHLAEGTLLALQESAAKWI